MKLNLTRPLIVFDLETTGLDFIRDRIIQISYIKVSPDGTEERERLIKLEAVPIELTIPDTMPNTEYINTPQKM